MSSFHPKRRSSRWRQFHLHARDAGVLPEGIRTHLRRMKLAGVIDSVGFSRF